MFEVAQITDKA